MVYKKKFYGSRIFVEGGLKLCMTNFYQFFTNLIRFFKKGFFKKYFTKLLEEGGRHLALNGGLGWGYVSIVNMLTK